MDTFKDRTAAGRALAQVLGAKRYIDPIVLALPRGGVPLAVEVAQELDAPLDLVMVRKIGVPSQPEVAVAAVVDGTHPELVVNETIAAHAGLSRQDIDQLAQVQLEEIKRRRAVYLKGKASVQVKGRTVIIVDDGIATGATVRAALRAVQRQKPWKLILAVPVASAEALSELRGEVDEIICLMMPKVFYAIGAYYGDFKQVSDDEVIELLAQINRKSSDVAKA